MKPSQSLPSLSTKGSIGASTKGTIGASNNGSIGASNSNQRTDKPLMPGRLTGAQVSRQVPRIKVWGETGESVVRPAPRGHVIDSVHIMCDEQPLSYEERVQLIHRLANKWGIPGFEDVLFPQKRQIRSKSQGANGLLNPSLGTQYSLDALPEVSDIEFNEFNEQLMALEKEVDSLQFLEDAEDRTQRYSTIKEKLSHIRQSPDAIKRSLKKKHSAYGSEISSQVTKALKTNRRLSERKPSRMMDPLNPMHYANSGTGKLCSVLKRAKKELCGSTPLDAMNMEDLIAAKVNCLRVLNEEVEEKRNTQIQAMPVWVQEMDTEYVAKKRLEAFFLQKHSSTRAEAYAARGSVLINIGDTVQITKKGSQEGKQAKVTIPDWDGRVAVVMDDSGKKKSYMANEIKIIAANQDTRTYIPEAVRKLMNDEDVDSWGFDVLSLHKAFHNNDVGVLAGLGLRLFEKHQFSQKLGLQQTRVLSFLHKIESLYQPLPYHNGMHGADVMRTIHYFYTNSELSQVLTPLEKLAGLFAGAVHDVNHPGYNNNFLSQSSHQVAIRYNDNSPLENYHCATAFSTAGSCQLLEDLPTNDRQILRKQVIAMILETDLKHHFSSLAEFEEKCLAQDEDLADVMGNPENRVLVQRLCITSADISHSAKPWVLHEQWSKRVLHEFFLQGDEESKRGMEISSLCDRKETNVWKAQTGFIDFIARPQFESWCQFLNSAVVEKDMIGNITENRAMWIRKQGEGESEEPYKNPDLMKAVFFEL